MEEDDRLLSIADLADLLGVPVATVRYWLHNGTAPDHFKIGRHIKFRLSDVERWLEARRRRGDAALVQRQDLQPARSEGS